LANFIRPLIIYRVCFNMKATGYFIDWLKYISVTIIALLLCNMVGQIIVKGNLSILTFIVMAFIITVIFNVIFIAVFYRCEEFKYLTDRIKDKLNRSTNDG